METEQADGTRAATAAAPMWQRPRLLARLRLRLLSPLLSLPYPTLPLSLRGCPRFRLLATSRRRPLPSSAAAWATSRDSWTHPSPRFNRQQHWQQPPAHTGRSSSSSSSSNNRRNKKNTSGSESNKKRNSSRRSHRHNSSNQAARRWPSRSSASSPSRRLHRPFLHSWWSTMISATIAPTSCAVSFPWI